jgi:hypothetical protein
LRKVEAENERERERERQRMGGSPATYKIVPRFLEGIDNPEMMVGDILPLCQALHCITA